MNIGSRRFQAHTRWPGLTDTVEKKTLEGVSVQYLVLEEPATENIDSRNCVLGAKKIACSSFVAAFFNSIGCLLKS
jgi:hypothetical protein